MPLAVTFYSDQWRHKSHKSNGALGQLRYYGPHVVRSKRQRRTTKRTLGPQNFGGFKLSYPRYKAMTPLTQTWQDLNAQFNRERVKMDNQRLFRSVQGIMDWQNGENIGTTVKKKVQMYSNGLAFK